MRIAPGALAALLLVVPLRAEEKPAAKSYAIPYKLTFTNHVMVRAKINGKGPFNFIVDTGAPALFVATNVAKKVGTKADGEGWGEFDKFELEGGLVLERARGKIDDPFQLEGMNGMGLAGIELHGMIGYNILAKYKITYDFTSDKLGLEEIPGFKPAAPPSFGRGGQGGLEIIGKLMRFVAPLLGMQMPERKPRGFLGVEFDEAKDGAVVKSVLPGGPADKAGLKAGDRVVGASKEKIDFLSDLVAAAARRSAGDEVKLTIERDGAEKILTLTFGKGL
jgi:hypothetical protein